MGKYFGTDGFRGEANVVLTVEHAFKVGRYLGWYFGQDHKARVVIGKDTRKKQLYVRVCAGSRNHGVRCGRISSSCYDDHRVYPTLVRTEDFDCGYHDLRKP